MLDEAFSHCRGIGPARLAALRQAGIRTWQDAIDFADRIPPGLRTSLTASCRRSLQARRDRDIRWLVESLAPRDKWRVLAEFFPDASFFDIETTGLEYDAAITVIACWHQQRLHTFVEHENLDDFLDLLHEARLLVSFNGASFDVPRVLSGFHIPELPCPHLDLRWPCFHRGLSGSLKSIAAAIGIRRPDDLDAADGALAVRLWAAWEQTRDAAARSQLIRYCSADVLLLLLIAQHVCGIADVPVDALWHQLPAAAGSPVTRRCRSSRAVGDSSAAAQSSTPPSVRPGTQPASVDPPDPAGPPTSRAPAASFDRRALVEPLFGPASPQRLRTRRVRGE